MSSLSTRYRQYLGFISDNGKLTLLPSMTRGPRPCATCNLIEKLPDKVHSPRWPAERSLQPNGGFRT